MFTAFVAVIMCVVGVAGLRDSQTACDGGTIAALAIPINTLLLIMLAFVQRAHYRTTAQVEKIVDQRKKMVIPPPDGMLKREDDPPK